MTVFDTVNRIFREFKRYSGDGLTGEPTGAPLPVGDPQSGVYSPKKSELRTAFVEILTAAIEAGEAAQAALTDFESQYLGAKTADPTLDNDGNALLAGALYFNTADGKFRVWTGSAWQDQSTALADGEVTRPKLAPVLSSSIAIGVMEYGAIGDGTADDRAAFVSADAVGEILLPPGTYKISSDLTLASSVRFMSGAVLSVPTGVTVTFNGFVCANPETIFSLAGTGKVAGFKKNPEAYAEWWGAVADGTTDSLAAINAAIVAAPTVQLLYGTYRTTGTVLMQTAHRTLRGMGKAWTTGNVGTIIAVDSASADAMLHGLGSNPGAINDHLQHANIEDLTVNRIGTIDSTAAARGVVSQWLLFAAVRNVECINHKTGFAAAGCVQIHYDKCYAFRSAVGTVPASDSFYGYFLNGGSGLAAAGGNASVYYDDCTAACALNVSQCPTNIGFGFTGPAADTFLRRGEVTSCITGIVVTGGGTQAGDADIHIQDCICDAIQSQGILFSNLGAYAAVKHTGNYYAPVSGATFTGIVVSSCLGMIESHGNQVVGWPATTTGISIGSSEGVEVLGDMLLDCTTPAEIIGSAFCRLSPSIRNPSISATGGGIVASGGTFSCQFAPIIAGGASKLAYGVNLDNTVTGCEVNATAISATAATHKVRISSVNYSAPGTYSGNLYSGL